MACWRPCECECEGLKYCDMGPPGSPILDCLIPPHVSMLVRWQVLKKHLQRAVEYGFHFRFTGPQLTPYAGIYNPNHRCNLCTGWQLISLRPARWCRQQATHQPLTLSRCLLSTGCCCMAAICTLSGGSAISSCASRRAVAAASASPGSALPPGRHTSPATSRLLTTSLAAAAAWQWCMCKYGHSLPPISHPNDSSTCSSAMSGCSAHSRLHPQTAAPAQPQASLRPARRHRKLTVNAVLGLVRKCTALTCSCIWKCPPQCFASYQSMPAVLTGRTAARGSDASLRMAVARGPETLVLEAGLPCAALTGSIAWH